MATKPTSFPLRTIPTSRLQFAVRLDGLTSALRRRRTSSGLPCCIVCGKQIPTDLRTVVTSKGDFIVRQSRYFHATTCAIKFAYLVAPDVVRREEDLDPKIDGVELAGPLLTNTPRLARDAVSRLRTIVDEEHHPVVAPTPYTPKKNKAHKHARSRKKR